MSFTYTDFANGLYGPTANTLGRVDCLADPLVLALLDLTAYTADQDADVSLADIPGAAIIASETPTGLTVVSRRLTCDPVVFAALTAPPWAAAVLYMDTGTAGTSPLIAYVDDYTAALDPPDGTDYTWNPPAGGFIEF